MVMRGLPNQTHVHPAGRCTQGTAFEHSLWPHLRSLGKAVERACTLLGFVRESGQRDAFTPSFLRGVWSEGTDATTDRGLGRIVERAGMGWDKARRLLRNSSRRADVEENRKALTELGLWVVPSFRVGQTTTWGQDRLWPTEDHLRGMDVQ